MLRQPGFAGLLGSACALGLGFSFVSPFLSLWGTQEVGLKPMWFGIYMTVTTLAAIVVSTSLARWSDTHLPRKILLMLGGLGGVLGYTGYALVRDPRLLMAIGCTALAVGAVCFSQLFAHVRERFSNVPGLDVNPGFLTSLVRVCFSLAWTAGPSIGAWVMVSYGFRGLFLGAAALYLVFLVGVIRFVPLERRPPHALAAVRQPVWRVLTRGDMFAVFVAFLLVFAAHAVNTMNLPLMLTHVLGANGRELGIVYGIGPVVELPLMLWFGHLASRGHQLALIRLGAAVTVLYFLGVSVAQEPWHVFPVQVLSGMSFAIMTNVAILFFQDLVPGEPGLATTIFANAGNVGNLIGYLCFGALVEAVGNRGVFFVSATLATATLVILLLFRARDPALPILQPAQRAA
jgi:MFS transporter, SET family, sugar efflux transporter